MVDDGAFSHKIDYVTCHMSKSQRASKSPYWFKSSAILLNGWIFSIGGASVVEGLQSARLPRLMNIPIQHLLTDPGGVAGAVL